MTGSFVKMTPEAFNEAIQIAIREENEACARIAEGQMWMTSPGNDYLRRAAAAIRARIKVRFVEP